MNAHWRLRLAIGVEVFGALGGYCEQYKLINLPYRPLLLSCFAMMVISIVLLMSAVWSQELWDDPPPKATKPTKLQEPDPAQTRPAWPYATATDVYDPRKPRPYDPQADIPTRLMSADHPTLVFDAYDYAPTEQDT